MRRIRSNLRTFRLLLDPAWGTTLRGELAWYGGRLGEVRDLHIIGDAVTITGPTTLSAGSQVSGSFHCDSIYGLPLESDPSSYVPATVTSADGSFSGSM